MLPFILQPNFVMKNKLYLCEELLPLAISIFRRISSSNPDILINIDIIRKNSAAPIPKKRSVYQTDLF